MSSKTIILPAVLGALGIAVWLTWAYVDWSAPPGPARTIRIQYSLRLQNETNRPIQDAQIAVYAPMPQTSFQQCIQTSASQSYGIRSDASGHQSLSFEWSVFAPFATKIVTIQSELKLWEQPRRTKEEDLSSYLHPEPLIESNDPAIMDLARQLSAESRQKTAQNIFDWVSTHVAYIGYVNHPRGARYALTYGQGDCSEYAYLFTALCRANGIAARCAAGFVCPQSMVLDLGDYHNWAQFYLDGCWQIADPQRKIFMREASSYIVFQIIRPAADHAGSLLPTVSGHGLKVKYNT